MQLDVWSQCDGTRTEKSHQTAARWAPDTQVDDSSYGEWHVLKGKPHVWSQQSDARTQKSHQVVRHSLGSATASYKECDADTQVDSTSRRGLHISDVQANAWSQRSATKTLQSHQVVRPTVSSASGSHTDNTLDQHAISSLSTNIIEGTACASTTTVDKLVDTLQLVLKLHSTVQTKGIDEVPQCADALDQGDVEVIEESKRRRSAPGRVLGLRRRRSRLSKRHSRSSVPDQSSDAVQEASDKAPCSGTATRLQLEALDVPDVYALSPPVPPDSCSWDWPLSRHERKTRVALMDKHLSSIDRAELVEELNQLQGRCSKGFRDNLEVAS
jgi:hypothetical protein